MNRETMLEKCRREQWKLTDLDWNVTPRTMSKDDEIAIVQYFTDMAEIERLAGALFKEEERKLEDRTLKAIFRTFVADEARHAAVAERLADFYNVHRYKEYTVTPALARFAPHFINTVRFLPPDIANTYITAGEVILDVALLRSINDYVHDEMSQRAMDLVNRDESRHIAVDFHMAEYYVSDEYDKDLARRQTLTREEKLEATWSFLNMLWFAAPFAKGVFFAPMEVVDPSGRRMREAFRRIQMLASKPGMRKRPFGRTMLGLQDMYRKPVGKRFFGPLLERVIGLPGHVMDRLISDEEERRAARMTFDQLAEETLGAKNVD